MSEMMHSMKIWEEYDKWVQEFCKFFQYAPFIPDSDSSPTTAIRAIKECLIEGKDILADFYPSDDEDDGTNWRLNKLKCKEVQSGDFCLKCNECGRFDGTNQEPAYGETHEIY
jgi:hypothetical protein